MKRGQKKGGLEFFQIFPDQERGQNKSYSKERPHLSKKDCSLCFNMGQSFF
jgi:hypothetical protein